MGYTSHRKCCIRIIEWGPVVELLSSEYTSYFFVESGPLISLEYDGEQNTLRYLEIFPGVWIEWWLREYTDEEIFDENPNSDVNAVLLRIMEERTRLTNSGRVCQLAVCPRVTEQFMIEQGFWDEPREIGIGELRSLFMAYCISIGANERMRIIGHMPCRWGDLKELKENPDYGDEIRRVTPIGQFLRTEGLLGEEMEKSLDFQISQDARWDTWDAAMLMFAGSETYRYSMFLWNYHRLIDTDDPYERIQYGIAALESLLPSQHGEITKSLSRRGSILMTPAGEARRAQGFRSGTYKRDEKKHKIELLRFLRIANKVKQNIPLKEKDLVYYGENLHHVIPYMLKAMNYTLLGYGKIPSLDEIDQAEGTGLLLPMDQWRFDQDVFEDHEYRWYLHFRPDITDEYHRIPDRDNLPFSDFLEQYYTDVDWDKVKSKLKEEPSLENDTSEVTEKTQSETTEEIVQDEGMNQDHTPETESEEDFFYHRCMLLGVPALLEKDGTSIGWFEVFPGLRIHWFEEAYPDDEVRSRCGDNLDFYHFKFMELASRDTCSGFVCELDVDPEETVRFLNENGMSHLSPRINNYVLYSIFRLFSISGPAFIGTRLMNGYNRGWSTLLHNLHDERNVKIVPHMGPWTVLMEPVEHLRIWPGQWPEPLIYEDIIDEWNKEAKPLLWRAAIMLIEDFIEDGRISRSVDGPLNAFQFARDSIEKNLAFNQILVTLLRPNQSKGQKLALITPAVTKVPQHYDEEEWKQFILEIVTESIGVRNDFMHGRNPDEEYAASIVRHQDEILVYVFATINRHGGIPDMELILEAVDTGSTDFEREWVNRIDQEVIEAENYRVHFYSNPDLLERYDELGGRETMTYDEFLDSIGFWEEE